MDFLRKSDLSKIEVKETKKKKKKKERGSVRREERKKGNTERHWFQFVFFFSFLSFSLFFFFYPVTSYFFFSLWKNVGSLGKINFFFFTKSYFVGLTQEEKLISLMMPQRLTLDLKFRERLGRCKWKHPLCS